jgi:hypothetical protein
VAAALPAGAVQYQKARITNNGHYLDQSPKINDAGQIVWYGWNGVPDDFELFFFSGGQISQLTNNDYPDMWYSINNRGQIVWTGANEGSGLYFYNDGHTTKLTSSGGQSNYSSPINDNGKIVYSQYDSGKYNIYVYDSTSGTTTKIIDNAYNNWKPLINNRDQIVYEGWNSSCNELFFYSGGITTQITNNDKREGAYQINNNGQIVWSCSDGSRDQIYLFDKNISNDPINISNNSLNNGSPCINNRSQVVWSCGSGNNWNIYLYDINSGKTSFIVNDNKYNIGPKINDSGQVVWVVRNGPGDDIVLYSNGTITNITDDHCNSNPQINNQGQIVWHKGDTDSDIYLATPQIEVANKLYGLFIGAEYENPLGSPPVIFRADKGAEILSFKMLNIPNYVESILLTTKMADGGTKKSDVEAAINYLKEYILKPGDGIVFYVNCHGDELKPESSPPVYVLAIGSERAICIDTINQYPDDYITDCDLNKMLSGMDVIQKWVFIDSCHSGGFYNSIHSLTNACLVASTTADLLAYGYDFGSGEVKGGLFTTALETGLTRKENSKFLWVDSDESGEVTLFEILEYLQEYNQKTDWVGTIVYELSFGDPIIFTLDKWNPTGFRTADFVGGILTTRKGTMAPVLHLLLD